MEKDPGHLWHKYLVTENQVMGQLQLYIVGIDS
jgi:hypothetical protein